MWRDRINQCLRQRTPHDNAVFMHDMTLNNPVTSMPSHLERPINTDSWMTSIVRIIPPQRLTWNIRTLEPLSIRKATGGKRGMHVSQTLKHLFRYIPCGHYQEINITRRRVKIPQRERAIQVQANELLTQNRLYVRE